MCEITLSQTVQVKLGDEMIYFFSPLDNTMLWLATIFELVFSIQVEATKYSVKAVLFV